MLKVNRVTKSFVILFLLLLIFMLFLDRDFICVQSLDGALSVFEQETFAFTRFLPNFLLPGPLAYIAHSDSILTVSSSYMLEAYR